MSEARPTVSSYLPRLAIIVPFRDREEHLSQFLPHMLMYFEKDKVDKIVPFTINIIEQMPGKPFNRGKLLNVGFDLTQADHEYFCFHDVDYLPIWADYSSVSQPTRLIWDGLMMNEDYNEFFGAVIALNKADFVKANGFGNDYWGWGPEDREFGMRCDLVGLTRATRDGLYQPLPHEHNGFYFDEATGKKSPKPDAASAHKLFFARQNNLAEAMKSDGLSTLNYKVVEKVDVPVAGKSRGRISRYKVEL